MDWRPGVVPDTVTVRWCTADGDERRRARVLLLRTAAELLQVPLSEVSLEHEPGGRPYLGGAGGPLRVSLTHGRGVLAVALTGRAPVGVDVEVVRRVRATAMARAWLDPAEAAWVEGLAERDRSAAFLWLWTQKEAVGKALGQGLRGGGMSRPMPLPRQWPPPEDAPGGLTPLPGAPGLASAAVVVGGGGHVVGVALHGREGDVRIDVCRVPAAACD
ncbi:4'-phosphopantetheinyl transferase family protein [Streptomyces sp. NPDC015220]|uniref:4'-phosphopantetheinyl transferase family protein n=1 Tax=Streptomyces sp. NPDC015220 TaxID=3364947 RepID=UPI0036FC9E48